ESENETESEHESERRRALEQRPVEALEERVALERARRARLRLLLHVRIRVELEERLPHARCYVDDHVAAVELVRVLEPDRAGDHVQVLLERLRVARD